MAKRSIKKKIRLLKKKRLDYAQEWKNNASYFKDNGYYEWMVNFLNRFDKILEIGTGNGTSTITLIENGHSVVSVDENIECLRMAYKKIKEKGVNVLLVERESINMTNDYYTAKYEEINIEQNDYDVILIEGDIVNDEYLYNWLIEQDRFDAVICWLIGSHGFRAFNKFVKDKEINHPGLYRLLVQNKVYELADRLLKKEGILHIVDRTEAPKTKELKNDFLNAHREQASATSLDVISLDYILFEMNSEGVEMGLTLGESGRIPEQFEFSLTSITSVKP